ncbi:FecCD family ABC transporter permease [Kribbella sindirgiensis]|nr:iron ABC transporter permease [Kribbella sindirgiensis]
MARDDAVAPERSLRLAVPPVAAMAVVLAGVVIGAVAVGRFGVPLPDVVRILTSRGEGLSAADQNVVLYVRLPRVLLALLVGGGLAIAGAALQAAFRNPLVSPEIIGVSSGASFGGALALLLGLGTTVLVGAAFGFGLVALVLVFAVTITRGITPVLMIVLAGVVTGSFFSALVSLTTYVADPYDQLPTIVFWLLGSVASASYGKVLIAVGPVLAGTLVLLLLRWRVNVLSLGDEEAAALGMRPGRTRWLLLTAVALIVAGAVAVSGVVSWVGLVVPHFARMWVGPDHRVLLPVTFLMGSAYLILIDTLARTVTAGEIPLGVLTALLGAPAFFVVLRRHRNRIWDDA